MNLKSWKKKINQNEKTDLHTKGFTTACKMTGKVILPFMEDQNVVLEVEVSSEALFTAFSNAFKHAPLPGVNKLFVLLQKPGIVEHLLAFLTWQGYCKKKYKSSTGTLQLSFKLWKWLSTYLCVRSFCASDTQTKFFLWSYNAPYHMGNLKFRRESYAS